jgi:ubiquinone biosynthesis protein
VQRHGHPDARAVESVDFLGMLGTELPGPDAPRLEVARGQRQGMRVMREPVDQNAVRRNRAGRTPVPVSGLPQKQDRSRPDPRAQRLECNVHGIREGSPIAQVHFAVTTGGEEVAVKVLRPGIERQMADDLDLFAWIAAWIERLQPSLRRLRPVAAVEIFAASTKIEMDLRLEAAAAAELADNCRDDSGFRVPLVDWRRTGRRVLTLERVQGLASDDREGLCEAGFDPDVILTRAAEILFKQVFRDGFFHADMHPGNMFIDAEGDLVPVDFGIMGRLDASTRRFLGEMLLGFLTADYKRVADVHFDAGYVPADKDRQAFMQACRSIAEPIRDRPLAEISIGRLLGQMFDVTENFAMQTQPQLLLLQKTMVVAEGVGRRLNPNVNMWQLAQPLIESWMIDNLGPQAQIRTVIDDGIETLRRLPHLIERAERALEATLDHGVKLDTVALGQEQRVTRSQAGWALILFVTGLVLGVMIS